MRPFDSSVWCGIFNGLLHNFLSSGCLLSPTAEDAALRLQVLNTSVLDVAVPLNTSVLNCGGAGDFGADHIRAEHAATDHTSAAHMRAFGTYPNGIDTQHPHV